MIGYLRWMHLLNPNPPLWLLRKGSSPPPHREITHCARCGRLDWIMQMVQCSISGAPIVLYVPICRSCDLQHWRATRRSFYNDAPQWETLREEFPFAGLGKLCPQCEPTRRERRLYAALRKAGQL